MTVNLGNYESARFDVSIEEVFAEGMSTDEAYGHIANDIELLVERELKRIKKELKR